jgi:hypothetical protein
MFFHDLGFFNLWVYPTLASPRLASLCVEFQQKQKNILIINLFMYISKHPFECRTFIPVLLRFIRLVLIQMKVEYIN